MIEISEKLLAILFSLLIFGQAYLIRRTFGTFLIPAALFSLAWFLYTIIPLIVLFNVPVNPLSIFYILICVSAFSLSSLPFNWFNALKKNELKTTSDYNQFNSKFIHYLFYISIFSSIIFTIAGAVSNGFDPYSMVFDLMKTSGQYATMRGHGELDYGNLGRLSIFFTYTTPILGGFISHHQKNKVSQLTILLLAFTPSLFLMLTQSTKLILFISIGFYCAAIFLMKIYSKKLELFNWHLILKFFGLILLVFPLISISFLSRDGFSDFDDAEKIIAQLNTSVNSYAFGQIYAFSDFFTHYLGFDTELNYDDSFNSYGYYTFKSILDSLGGDKEFPIGIFEEGYSYKNVVATNIYTIFRGLIYDFGGVGAICFMFAFGLLIHTFFYRVLNARNSWFACSVFIVSVAFIEFTYLMSIFMARYAYLILVALGIILWANNKYWMKNYKHE